MNKNKLVAIALALTFSQSAYSKEIETIVVVGSTSTQEITDPRDDFTFIETIMPTAAFTAGGYGGFGGFTERGTQTIHTSVFRNGVPGNDAGSGWYDFGHNIATGNERVKVVNGPNSVLYGSGSLAGTVFINDKVADGGHIRLGKQHTFINNSFGDAFNITYLDVNNGSVRTDNTENDYYRNASGTAKVDIDQFTVIANYTEYSYDYDDCYTSTYQNSNDCEQKGNKGTLSIRNDYITLGYSFNQAEYFTEADQTWESDAERFYFDARDNSYVGAVNFVYGVTANREKYIEQRQDDYSVYVVANLNDVVDVGLRLSDDSFVYRIGVQYDYFFANYGTSFRNPTLYEINGDSWVASNFALAPEQAQGGEIGFGPIGLFYYDFEEGIDYNFSANQFTNTGSYSTQGVRFNGDYNIPYGSVSVFLGYTDSAQPRVPEYKSSLRFSFAADDYNFSITFVNQFNRGTDWNGIKLEDVNTADFVISKLIQKNLSLSFTVQDMFDNEFEITPGYGAGGRNLFLTLSYK